MPSIGAPRWTRSHDDDGRLIRFIWNATPAVSPSLVVMPAVVIVSGVGPQMRVFAFDREDGAIVWHAILPELPMFDSQSSVTLDLEHGRALMPVRKNIYALRLSDGTLEWTTQLEESTVNATLCVTDDLGCRDRAFMTDYSYLGATFVGKLYCINLSPFDAVRNPYQPGDIVWSAPLQRTSGNSPAYVPRRLGGVGLVYVASSMTPVNVGDPLEAGKVYAFPADAETEPNPAWIATNTQLSGFFGGVSAVIGASGGVEVFASSYEFSGTLYSANILRLDGRTGVLLGGCASNRTNSTPVIMPNHLVAISGGLIGFDTDQNVALLDASSTLGMIWESLDATWIDANMNTFREEGEFERLGGWQYTPAARVFSGRAWLSVGPQSNGAFSGPSQKLAVLDLSASPRTPQLIPEQFAGAGGSPAIAGANLYSVGTLGLCAFGPEPERFDINDDKRIGVGDLVSWERGYGDRDVNDDGLVDVSDRDALLTLIRSREVEDLSRGVRP